MAIEGDRLGNAHPAHDDAILTELDRPAATKNSLNIIRRNGRVAAATLITVASLSVGAGMGYEAYKEASDKTPACEANHPEYDPGVCEYEFTPLSSSIEAGIVYSAITAAALSAGAFGIRPLKRN